jgi:hypothetical protein
MVHLLEQGRPCSSNTPKKHKHFPRGLDYLNKEQIQDASNYKKKDKKKLYKKFN